MNPLSKSIQWIHWLNASACQRFAMLYLYVAFLASVVRYGIDLISSVTLSFAMPSIVLYGTVIACDFSQNLRMTTYKYTNEDLDQTNMLYESNGVVAWRGRDWVTAWHGSFFKEAQRLIITFDCRGDTTRLKTTLLNPVALNRWTGYDYAARFIQLEQMDTKRWCRTCRAWHPWLSSAPSRGIERWRHFVVAALADSWLLRTV